MDDQQFTFYTFPALANEMQAFTGQYTIDHIAIPPNEPRRKFKARTERVCRFCGRRHPETTFKHDPHVIPQLLGNRYLVSDFECDHCNSLFSKYESSLADYLGIERTIFESLGNKKAPKFKSQDKLIEASGVPILENQQGILISDQGSDNIKFDPGNGRTTISYTLPKYTPIFVYKALLKIALSLINDDDVPKYRLAFDFLLSDNQDQNYRSLLTMLEYNYSRTAMLHAFVFKKLESNPRLPTHVFSLYYQQRMFQLFLPFFEADRSLYDGKSFEPLFSPPLLITPVQSGEGFERRLKDFSGREKVSEEGEISMQFLPTSAEELAAFDPLKLQALESLMASREKIAKLFLFAIEPGVDYKTLLKDKFKK